MRNFTTNQTRNLYVATSKLADTAEATLKAAAPLAIALGTTKDGLCYLIYRNADGDLTRSDTFDPKKISSLKFTEAADMDKPLIAHVVKVDEDMLPTLVGAKISCKVTIHEMFDYDDSNTTTVVATIVGNAVNTASAEAFHKAMALAIAKVLPITEKAYPLVKVYSSGAEVLANTPDASVDGSAHGIVLVEAPQKYVRGKLTGEPIHISVAFEVASDVEEIVWGTDTRKTVAEVNTDQSTSIAPVEITGTHALADLEWFALGERGDVYRGFNYPNDYTPTYAVDLAKKYDVLTIEYYWNGGAEHVQKSPRMIQVASPVNGSADSVAELIYKAVDALK